ncbi:MAG: hypothetical protein R2912_01125 [Eubacteriales bacterium]
MNRGGYRFAAGRQLAQRGFRLQQQPDSEWNHLVYRGHLKRRFAGSRKQTLHVSALAGLSALSKARLHRGTQRRTDRHS